jgi:hypothetical protein
MKNNNFSTPLITLMMCLVFFTACEDTCKVTNTFYYYEPVYEEIETVRASVALDNPRPIKALGKIYYKDQYLYLNEPGEGIHIIDNRNPQAPIQVAFIIIPGNYSLAAKGNTLYANSYMDLVCFDISNPLNVSELDRLNDVFLHYSPNVFYFNEMNAGRMVVDWEYKSEVEINDSECEPLYYQDRFFWGRGIATTIDMVFMQDAFGGASRNSGSAGIGGSMATFTIYDNYLYAIDQADIILADISEETSPALHSKMHVGWGIETLFPYEDKLFIGANDGMYIYDNSKPSAPAFISKYIHVNSCDPVVVQGDYAYVTLRSGTQCAGFSNQLEVINITNLKDPQIVATYPMFNPHGLGIDGDALFICDGTAGLKIYDASDILAVDDHLLKQYSNLTALDVIPLDDVLMMISDQGLFQYDYSDLNDIKLLSSILISENAN